MGVRKEQVLAGLALVFGGWLASGHLKDAAAMKRYAPQQRDYAGKPVPSAPLVTTDAAAPVRRDFCTEPSETQPLPPRQLEFPARPPLTLAPLPLDPGPDLRHGYALRVDGAVLPTPIAQTGEAAPVEGAAPAEGGPAAAPSAAPAGAPAAAPAQGADALERAAQSYDRLWLLGQRTPLYGTIEVDGKDLFALEERPDFDGVTLRMRVYEVSKQRQSDIRVFGEGVQKIEKIQLAGSLRNEITRRERKVREDVSGLPERRDLILWLLERARETAWVYDKAWQHAQTYHQIARGDLESLRLQQKVLRARGDLAGELALLEALPPTGAEGAFRFEGLGQLKAGLGLFAEAEADLAKACELQPSDARPHAARAEFLRQRGRTAEARFVAAQVARTLNGVQDPADKARCGRVLVACHLAAGDVAAAREAMAAATGNGPVPYLDGCLQYAQGDATAAMASFAAAAGSADGSAAGYARAAGLALAGKGQESHDLLLRIYDQEPLWRHRAATALAWLFLRSGQYESALGWIDRALEADPQDTFAFYLRGRTLRLAGQLDAAREALTQALRLRDDFVHAIAEMAEVQAARAVERGDVDAAIAARRYSDRAVALAAAPSQELYELQGLHCQLAGDALAAKEAFARSRDLVADDKLKWYGKGAIAVVDYGRGQFEEAERALQRMTNDLSRDDPMAKWAAARLADMYDHAEKESLVDGFERPAPGDVWFVDVDGQLEARIDAGRLGWTGTFRGKNEVYAERREAIKKGKNFLAMAATVVAGPKQPTVDTFYGIGFAITRNNGSTECLARLGVKDGKPFVYVEDGQDNGAPSKDQKALAIDGFDPRKAQQLELRVVPVGDAQAKKFELVASWNGVPVHRHELRMLSGNTSTELKTQLFASGRKGDAVDVAFDDYRLERRKER